MPETAVGQEVSGRIGDQQTHQGTDKSDGKAVAQSAQCIGIRKETGQVPHGGLAGPVGKSVVDQYEQRRDYKYRQKQNIGNTQTFSGQTENRHTLSSSILNQKSFFQLEGHFFHRHDQAYMVIHVP